MKLFQKPSFQKKVKKLHKNQKNDLKKAIEEILKTPTSGQRKKGDLSDLRVYKFKMSNQVALLAYEYNSKAKIITLTGLGSHENFYRDLKR